MSDGQQVPTVVLLRGIVSFAVVLIVLGVIMFIPAGDIRWTKGWLFLLTFLAFTIGGVVYLWRTNPEVFVARNKIHAGTKTWDRLLMACQLLSLLAIFPVAAFDAGRFHGSSVPRSLTVVGYVLLSVGFFIAVRAESVNKFAEPSVRIQIERGHKVVDTGPYAIVRHPMYVSVFFLCAGAPLALGSYWAFISAPIAITVLVVRTVLEDRTLQSELTGYKEYTSRVRHRLIPGIW